jgi:DNA-dependent RNA polymerase auxiliary subunit epsilon
MSILNEKINYKDLTNKKQKEIYNFQKISAILADRGYSVTLLRDDVEFADFVAVPFNKTTTSLWVQLKSGYTARKKYLNKNLHICFRDIDTDTWYLYPHDELCKLLEDELKTKEKWVSEGVYEGSSFSAWAKDALDKYKIDL